MDIDWSLLAQDTDAEAPSLYLQSEGEHQKVPQEKQKVSDCETCQGEAVHTEAEASADVLDLLKVLGANEIDLSQMREREIIREESIRSLEAELVEMDQQIAACVELREQTLERMRLEYQQKLNQKIDDMNQNSISRLKAQRQKQQHKDFMSFFSEPLTFLKFSCCHDNLGEEFEFVEANTSPCDSIRI
jgi:hypothetical protein